MTSISSVTTHIPRWPVPASDPPAPEPAPAQSAPLDEDTPCSHAETPAKIRLLTGQRFGADCLVDLKGAPILKIVDAAPPPTASVEPAPIAATPAIVSTQTPTADPLEIASLELLLADPAIQEIIQHFGGPRELPAGGNPVADSLNERYGTPLVIQLNQLQVAQKEIQRQYVEAVNTAGVIPHIQSLMESFNLEAFTRHWAEGERPVQKAWQTLYGQDIFKGSPHLPKLKYFRSIHGFTPHFVLYGNTREHINPAHPPDRMIEPEWVWFDPQRGWLTDRSNFQPESNKIGKIFGGILSVAASYVTWGATASYGIFAQGAATAAAGSAVGQLTSSGSIRFKNLFQSALAGGFTAGILKTTGLGSSANSFGQRLLQHTGKATLQGAIQTALGSQFKDGVVNSLMSGVASEVGALLHAEIARTPNLSEPEASTLRLMARATESALRIAANPEDKSYAFASDFLGTLMRDFWEEATQETTQTESVATIEAAEDIEASTTERGNRFDDEIFMEHDPYFIDIASMNGKELAAQAGRGMGLLEKELQQSGRTLIAKEVYFLPDGVGMKYIKIDGVYIDNNTVEEIKNKKNSVFFGSKNWKWRFDKKSKNGPSKTE